MDTITNMTMYDPIRIVIGGLLVIVHSYLELDIYI